MDGGTFGFGSSVALTPNASMFDGGTQVQVQQAVDATQSTAIAVMRQLPETVSKTLTVLADKLKVPVEFLVDQGSRYVFAKGVADLAQAGLYLIACLVLVVGLWKAARFTIKSDVNELHIASWAVGGSLSTILLAVSCCRCANLLSSGLTKVIAPTGSLLVSVLSGNVP